MHTNTGVCQFDSDHGFADPQTSPDALAHLPEPPPALHTGNADSLFDQLMQETQPRRAIVAANPYFVLGRIARDTVDMLIDGLFGLGRHASGSIKAIDGMLQIGPTGALAQAPAPESPCGAADASSRDMQGMHWKLTALTPEAFWACAKAKGLDQAWFRGRLVVLIEPEVGAHDAAMLAGRLRWNSRNQILERSDRQLLDALAVGIVPGERDRQVSRLLRALNAGIGTISSFVHGKPSLEQVWERVSRNMREPSLASAMASFIEKVNQLNEMLETREIERIEAEHLQAVRQRVIRAAETLDRLDRERPEVLPAMVWKQLEMLSQARLGEDRTDFLILEPEAGRRFMAENPDREAVVITLAGARRSSFATSVPELRIRNSVEAIDGHAHPGADAAAQPMESESCEVAGDCG